MPNVANNQELAALIDEYKHQIGEKHSYHASVNNYSAQELQQLIWSENQQIKRAVRLKGFPTDNCNLEEILCKYHESEIENNKRINIAIIFIIFLGMGFLGVGIAGRIFGFLQDGTISVISGVVTEIIGAMIKVLQNASDKSKHKYFEALNQQKRMDNIVKLVEGMSQGAQKNKMISKIIEEHFNSIRNEKEPS